MNKTKLIPFEVSSIECIVHFKDTEGNEQFLSASDSTVDGTFTKLAQIDRLLEKKRIMGTVELSDTSDE
jgi:hypothetical protein